MYTCICAYTYIYIYIYVHRYRFIHVIQKSFSSLPSTTARITSRAFQTRIYSYVPCASEGVLCPPSMTACTT